MDDPQNMLGRLEAALPRGWFPDTSPVLDVPLSGSAALLNQLYQLLSYIKQQTRIATAGDVFLDLIAQDYLGWRVSRRPGQGDDAFRRRIQVEILRPRATRQALISALTDLTGVAPQVFEPRWAPDTGGVGWQGMTVGTGLSVGGAGVVGAGGWGSLNLPFQFFVTAYSGNSQIGGVGGVMGAYYGSGWAGGGIGTLSNFGATAGAIEVASSDMAAGIVTEADIYSTIQAMIPVGTIAWTKIQDFVPPSWAPQFTNTSLYPFGGTVFVTGFAPSIANANLYVSPTTGAIFISGVPATVSIAASGQTSVVLQPLTGSLSITGRAATISTGVSPNVIVTPLVGTIAITGNIVTISTASVAPPPADPFTADFSSDFGGGTGQTITTTNPFSSAFNSQFG